MIISIMTMLAGAVIFAAVAKYMMVQEEILTHPLYSYIFWHILLFVILLMLFYETRHGFRKTISICSWAFCQFNRERKRDALDCRLSRYRERTRKVYLSTVLVSVAITISIAFMLYSELFFFSVVVSDSMSPALNKGDLILMQDIFVKPEKGDIITARVPGVQLPVMHRITSVSGDMIRTKGDANPSEDPWSITESQIIGESVNIAGKPVLIRNLGWYFIVDASGGGRTYGPEFNAVSTLIKGIKAAGFVIFILCLTLYLVFSIREARRTRW